MLDKLKYQNRISMKELLQEFCGEFSIPIMTIHKSKGLEYHTVILLELKMLHFGVFLLKRSR